MSALTQQDFAQLDQFRLAGDRYSYWKYLSDRGDGYATLALGVVTNETQDGYIANGFLVGRAGDLGKIITSSENWQIGADLIATSVGWAKARSAVPTRTLR